MKMLQRFIGSAGRAALALQHRVTKYYTESVLFLVAGRFRLLSVALRDLRPLRFDLAMPTWRLRMALLRGYDKAS